MQDTQEMLATENVLNSVNDQIMKKKKRKRQIIFSIISAVVLALAITIITLSSIKIDLKPFFISQPSRIEVTLNSQSVPWLYTEEDEEYAKINNLFNNSFKTNYMTALFSGEYGNYEVVETSDKFYSSYSDGVGSGMSSTLKSNLGSNYIHFYYATSQQVYNHDKTLYHSNRNTAEYTIEYVDVYFSLEANDDGNVTFYFGSTGALSNKIVKITVSANISALYNYVAEL